MTPQEEKLLSQLLAKREQELKIKLEQPGTTAFKATVGQGLAAGFLYLLFLGIGVLGVGGAIGLFYWFMYSHQR